MIISLQQLLYIKAILNVLDIKFSANKKQW